MIWYLTQSRITLARFVRDICNSKLDTVSWVQNCPSYRIDISSKTIWLLKVKVNLASPVYKENAETLNSIRNYINQIVVVAVKVFVVALLGGCCCCYCRSLCCCSLGGCCCCYCRSLCCCSFGKFLLLLFRVMFCFCVSWSLL